MLINTFWLITLCACIAGIILLFCGSLGWAAFAVLAVGLPASMVTVTLDEFLG